MKYQPPYGSSDSDAPYINATPGQKGSPVPAEAIEHPQREIVNVIINAGLNPDAFELTQLSVAIQTLIDKAIEASLNQQDPFFLGEFYYFRHPKLKEGFEPAQGGIIQRADAFYPEAWEYFQTTEGKQLCKTEAQWQAMTKATWATLADGTKVGFNGIGGAPFYVQDLNAGTLRLPDVRGMYAEASGFDGLGVGGVHGDIMRKITGEVISNIPASIVGGRKPSGAFYRTYKNEGAHDANTGWNGDYLKLDSSRVAPTGNANKPRAWGANACVYLGKPNITS